MRQQLAFELYFNGLVMTLKWSDERNYLRGTHFLKDLVGGPASEANLKPDEIPFYTVETQAQLDAIFDFKRNLERIVDESHPTSSDSVS